MILLFSRDEIRCLSAGPSHRSPYCFCHRCIFSLSPPPVPLWKGSCLLSISVWINIIYIGVRKDKHFCLFFFFFLTFTSKVIFFAVYCEMFPKWSKTLMRVTDHRVAALLKTHNSFLCCFLPPVPLLNGRIQELGSRHQGLGQTLEEICRVRVSGKGEIPPRVEKQNVPAEVVHDESPEAGPHDVRCQVRDWVAARPLLRHLRRIVLMRVVWWKAKGQTCQPLASSYSWQGTCVHCSLLLPLCVAQK